jgi:hypothetical protein
MMSPPWTPHTWQFAVPVIQIAVFVIACAGAGFLAAIRPARPSGPLRSTRSAAI